jgi:hypothetical protein
VVGDLQALAHVCTDKLESSFTDESFKVLHPSGRQVIDAENPVAPGNQCFTEVRAEESCPTRHNNQAHTSPMPS